MRNRTILRGLALAGVASLSLAIGVGGAAAGGNGKAIGKLSAKQCSQEKKAMGKDAFDQLYGKPSQPNCMAAARSTVAPTVKNSSQECKAERADLGAEAFANKYGSNKNRKNAFGKCVSRKATPEVNAETAKRVNAAQACKAEQQDPNFPTTHESKTFGEFYGSNPNDANAFGKCVSTKVETTA